jgi:hypothetical protein
MGILERAPSRVVLGQELDVLLEAENLHHRSVGANSDAGAAALEAAQGHPCHSGTRSDLPGRQPPPLPGQSQALAETL